MCYEIAARLINSTGSEQGLLDLVNAIGGSGGASNCTVNSTTLTTVNPDPTSCSGGYGKPTWQTGVTGIPPDSKRDIPDVSFFAGNGFLGSAYLVCVSDAGACVTSATSTTEPTGEEEIGGTSVASPAMAGVMALINQKAGSAQGNPNSELYTLAGMQTYSSCSTETVLSSSSSCYFNDIDTGTNAMACAAGSPSCTLAATGNTYGVLNGFDAGVGYDQATGLGSLNVANVVNAWPVSIGTAAATVAVSASPSTITAAQGTTVTVTVTGGSGTPTGTVVLTSGSFTSATQNLSGGTVAITVTAGQLAVGTDTVKASYSGDGTYAGASETTTVTVTPLPTPTVTVTPAALSLDAGQTLNVTVAVTGSGATPTGMVTLSGGGYTSSAQSLASGSSTISIPANSLSAGTDSLTVSYGGDSNYGAGTGSANVTVAASAYALAATAPAAVSPGSSATSTISLNSSTFYTGTVALTCALTTSPAGASDVPGCSVSSGGTIAVNAGTPGGTGTVTVTTTAATTAMHKPHAGGWNEAEGGVVLALLMLFGIPARRRGWRAMLGAVVLLATLGSLAACGGGGGSSSGGGGGGGNPGTTAGSYTFTVTGTGNDPAKTKVTAPFTLTVN